MYKIKRFSIASKLIKKGKDAIINTSKKAKHAVMNPKETAKAIGKYAKENPDEAIMMVGSSVIPMASGAYYAKKGNKKRCCYFRYCGCTTNRRRVYNR